MRDYKYVFAAHEHAIFLSSPIRTVPSALELPQIMLLFTEWLAGSTADQELGRQLIYLPSPCPEDISQFKIIVCFYHSIPLVNEANFGWRF